MSATIDLKVSETLVEDVGKGFARLDPEDIKALGGVLGDLIEMSGEKKTVARITGTFPDNYGKKIIQIDGITRSNAEVNLGEIVRIKKIPYKIAMTVLLTPLHLTKVIPAGNELGTFSQN